ncbi:DUF1236 domain-containing protein [Rhizobium sp. TRM95111]|uniref:DUF1236 domain-containing protein n=1 Tax=Rhizobium alarense TaxID=2846851 RepID=UPI001F1A5EA1|nr:DUF1236 domain-containing protein [Rhizobium alarense]MCF3639145.1 DUF1236 domain-containing protein [Rhizobium alarense]
MRKILLAGVALALIGATAAKADDSDQEAIGGIAGGATGAAAGAVIGGPVGAIVGGVAGATFGAAATVPKEVQVYVMENPTQSVVVQEPITEEYRFAEGVPLTPVPEHPDLAYVYVDNRPVVVEAESRRVVYAPAVEATTTGSIATPVPETTITYIESNPVEPVMLEGPVATGTVIPEAVQIVDVPESPSYGYIYVDDRPVLVDRGTRQVIWVR